jgi:hypothetical protein
MPEITSSSTLKFGVVIKKGVTTLASVEGVPRNSELITFEDVNKVIEVEQWLEKLTGLRFHIQQIIPAADMKRK